MRRQLIVEMSVISQQITKEVKCWIDRDSRVKLTRMARYYLEVKIVLIGPEFFRECEKGLCRLISHWECAHAEGRR
jgi:hypothetical protein